MSSAPCNTEVGEETHLLDKHSKRKAKHRNIRKLKSKGVIVTILLFFLVYGAFCSLFKMSTELHGYFSKHKMQYLPGSITLLLLTSWCPVAGWLADVYFGRYKVMRFGMWLMWFAMLVGSVSIVVLSQLHNQESGISFYVTAGVGYSFGFIVFPIGFSAFAVNAVQFGLDQMPEASANEISAYIHWLVWAIFAGWLVADLTSVIYYCGAIDAQTNDYFTPSLQVIIPMTLLSLAVSCDSLFGRWLIVEPESQNPLKTVFGVLKFSATHKRPIGRLTITYCEEEKPSRLDFAKEKFRGPYTTEEVEDVKTFFRMLVVIASTIAFSVPFLLYTISTCFLGNHFNMGYKYKDIGVDRHFCGAQSKQIAYSVEVFAVLIIPLYEFLIYPLVVDRVPRMLQRVGIAAALTIVLTVAIFAIDTIQHASGKTMHCMFSQSLQVLNPNSAWIAAPSHFVRAIQLVLYIVAILEFTCAQAPYSMRGLLLGVVNSLTFFSFPLAYSVFTVWHHFWKRLPSIPSCDFYYFIFQILCAVFGLVLLCFVTSWYKRRQRDNPLCYQAMIESVFERGLQPSNATRKQTAYTYLS